MNKMKFMDLAKMRYSVRKYEEKIVEKEKLDLILAAGRIAPTAANLQPQRLIVIQQKDSLAKLKAGANVYGAPLAIIVCSDHTKTWKRPFDKKDTADIDASIITDHMMLQATELGLGTVWVCYFDPKIVKESFNIPDNLEPINILAIGYASDETGSLASSPDRHSEQRKPLEDTAFYETF
jgi:nitroreductase